MGISNEDRIAEAKCLFTALWNDIPSSEFVYLIKFTKGISTYPFKTGDFAQLNCMAKQAIYLSDTGIDLWHSVNPVNTKPYGAKRGSEQNVSYQSAVITDIDISSLAHKGDISKLVTSFDEAVSFLPFKPSFIINSGYGLHAYYIFDKPLKITDENREEAKRRNNYLLDIIRQRSNGKKIDGVGDLPRIFRTPGTYNYKLGLENGKLCHIVENTGLRFSPEELDKLLKEADNGSAGSVLVSAETSLFAPANSPATEGGNKSEAAKADSGNKSEAAKSSATEGGNKSEAAKADSANSPTTEGGNKSEAAKSDSANSPATEGGNKSEAAKADSANSPAAAPPKVSLPAVKKLRKYMPHEFDDDPALKEFRIKRMLECINICKGEYEKWMGVGFALFSEGMNCSDWDSWSSTQPEYKPGECYKKWNHFGGRTGGMTIGSLYHWATQGGYDEQSVQNEYYELHPEKSKKGKKSSVLQKIRSSIAQMKSPKTSTPPGDEAAADSTTQGATPTLAEKDALQTELNKVQKEIKDFHVDGRAAIASLKKITTFTAETFLNSDVIAAAACANIFDMGAFVQFKSELTKFNRNNPSCKIPVNEWVAKVKVNVTEFKDILRKLYNDELTLKFRIDSLKFIDEQKMFEGDFLLPEGYKISMDDGVELLKGAKVTQVCRRPVAISEKFFDTGTKKFKIVLSYMTTKGKWKALPPVPISSITNSNKIVELSDYGLPVTSLNSAHLVKYLDALNAENEDRIMTTYTVSRCGWHTFGGKELFVDPRIECKTSDDDDNEVKIKVDSQSVFAESLRSFGKFDVWEGAYLRARDYPVARFITATAVAAPLLKVLGERNFLVYVNAPTRAGKTTALCMAASAVGDERIIRSFDATKNGLAGAACEFNDYPFLIDEKQVADSKIKEQLDLLVYALANGIGRTKLNRDSTLNKVPDWRTIPIMTGETQLLPDNVTGGAHTRLLTLSAPNPILPSITCKRIRAKIKYNYGFAFPLVVEKINELGAKILRELYSEIISTFDKEFSNVLEEHRRYVAIITLADFLLSLALSESFTEYEKEKLLDDSCANAREIFALIPSRVEIADVVREEAAMRDFIVKHQNRFVGSSTEVERMPVVYGKINDGNFYYITVAAVKELCKIEQFDYKKVVSDLIESGFFVRSDVVKPNYRKPLAFIQKRIGKLNVNCFRIPRTAFDIPEEDVNSENSARPDEDGIHSSELPFTTSDISEKNENSARLAEGEITPNSEIYATPEVENKTSDMNEKSENTEKKIVKSFSSYKNVDEKYWPDEPIDENDLPF